MAREGARAALDGGGVLSHPAARAKPEAEAEKEAPR